MKRFSTLLAFREMQIKSTVGHRFTTIRMARIERLDSDKHRPGCGEGKTLCPAGKNGNQAADWKTGFLYDSAVLLLGVHSREMGMFIHTKP